MFGTRSKLTVGALVAALTACGGEGVEGSPQAVPLTGEEVNIYSSRHYDTDLSLYSDFTDATGIAVNRIEASADALIERIRAEGAYSPADLLVTVDAGRLWRAAEAGILSPVDSAVLEARVPSNLRDPEGLWFAISKRARVIIYNQDGKAIVPPRTYADLADPAYRGKVCMRSSSNIYNISLLASIIANEGADVAERWAEGVVANFARPPQGNDTGNIESVASGECDISIANTYYIARMRAAGDAAARDIGIVFPDQEGNGTHINISGVGVTANAPNREAAIRFLEYLTDDSAQAYFANGNNEYPVVDGVAPTATVSALGSFEEDDLDASALGVHQAEAVRIFDRVGWQ